MEKKFRIYTNLYKDISKRMMYKWIWYNQEEWFTFANWWYSVNDLVNEFWNDKSPIVCKVMQYAWFNDRRNNEIYEWDIIQVYSSDWMKSYRFTIDNLYSVYNNSIVEESSFWTNVEAFEIIWNIYTK